MATPSSVRHKHVRIDQAKLDKARKVFAAATETETLDRALTLVVLEAMMIDEAHARRHGCARPSLRIRALPLTCFSGEP